MKIYIHDSPEQLGAAAGVAAAALINDAIDRNGVANIILATGTSQLATLQQLTSEPFIDWSKVVMFHLDEYIGLPPTHPASFRKYLMDRFIKKVRRLKAVFLIKGEANAKAECKRIGALISKYPIDVALVGIGENGHLAFNDPPADFETEQPYIIVELDEACRQQQVSEGWFKSLEDVPQKAISMSVKKIVQSKYIICSVPGERKALAVKNTLEWPVSNLRPASILQQHRDCALYLDKLSASLLPQSI